jgi:hypothetical protein
MTFQMMVKGISAILAKLASLLPGPIPAKNRECVANIVYQAGAAGYSMRNIKELIQQFNNETANGKDYKFNDHNACFGMIVPSWSENALGPIGGEGTARYPSVSACVEDRLIWDKRQGINGKSQTYLEDVQRRNYNASTSYPTTVRKYSDESSTVTTSLIVLPAIALGVGYIYSRL